MYPRQACDACGFKEIYPKPIEDLLWIADEHAIVKEKIHSMFERAKEKMAAPV